MPASVQQPPPQWPLRPDARLARRDWSEEFLTLERVPRGGKITGLSVAIANWLGVDVLLVRALFVVTALSAGFGLMLYLAGWLLTRDARTGTTPLDRVGTHWHQLPGRVVAGWALALSALVSLTFGSALGTNWFGVIMLGATAWLGSRSRRHPPTLTPGRAPARVVYRPMATGQVPLTGATRQPRHTTVPAAIGTLGVAVLVAGLIWENHPDGYILPLAGALLVLGIGLVLIAWHGRSVLLVVCGILVACALATAVAVQPAASDRIVPTSQADLSDTTLTDADQAIDLTQVRLVTDSSWTITVTSSALELVLPPGENIHLQVRYTDSMVHLPDDLRVGTGTASLHQTTDPSEPELWIVVDATSSVVWVTS